MIKLLQVKNLCKTFLFEGKDVLVLENISFDVFEKDFVSIIGPSGCGKSTLLELLAGITDPDCGVILMNENDITGQAGYAGYMPQDDLLLPWLSLLENAILPERISKKNLTAAKLKVMELLPDFGLMGYEHHKPWQLSGGMKQRAAFLRTVMSESNILLLDEPFANLDALTRMQMQKWLQEIKQKLGLTIILVTHDIDEAIRLSDRIYVMDSKPASFIHMEKISEDLRTRDNETDARLWDEIKGRLTAKLLR